MCWIVSESYTPGPANGIVEAVRRGAARDEYDAGLE
jgi:hypothetical protein